MINGPMFAGDANEHVMHIQHGMYQEMLGLLSAATVTNYLERERRVDAIGGSGVGLRSSSGFDPQSLEFAHDAVAAWFRFTQARELHPQLPGTHDYPDDDARLQALWRSFFCREMERLFASNTQFAHCLVRAAYFPSVGTGGEGIDSGLAACLREIYKPLFLCTDRKAISKGPSLDSA